MDQPTSKVCTGCGVDRPLTDYHRGSGRYGLRTRCKHCRVAENAAWKRANPERQTYPPDVFARRKARGRERAERYASRSEAELVADWQRLRPSGLKRCRQCHGLRPRDHFAVARHQADGRYAKCKLCHRRRAGSGGRPPADLLDYWAANGMSPHACTYCGTKLNYLGSTPTAPRMHIDHIHPVALGGTNEAENLAPACPSCNCSKGAKSLAYWLTGAAAAY